MESRYTEPSLVVGRAKRDAFVDPAQDVAGRLLTSFGHGVVAYGNHALVVL